MAVRDAVQRHVAPLIEQLKSTSPPAMKPEQNEPDHIATMTELCERPDCNRTIVIRKMRAGKVPQRSGFPNVTKGWLASEIGAWFSSAPTGEGYSANRVIASRISRH